MDWELVAVASIAVIAIAEIAIREWRGMRREKPSPEAVLSLNYEERQIMLVLSNGGSRPAQDLRYRFVPKENEDPSRYTDFGCYLEWDTWSAPFTMLHGYPLEFWVVSFFQTTEEDGSFMPPFYVEIKWKRSWSRKKERSKKVIIDTRFVTSLIWKSDTAESVMQKVKSEQGLFTNISKAALCIIEYFGRKNLEDYHKFHSEKCLDCNLLLSEHYFKKEPKGERRFCPNSVREREIRHNQRLLKQREGRGDPTP